MTNEKFYSVIDNSPAVAWTSDADGNTTYISRNVEKIYGYTPAEIYKGGPPLWFGRVHEDDIANVKKAYKEVFSRKKPLDIEYRVRKKDGEWIWLHDQSFAPYRRDGSDFVDGVFTNITERKVVEEKLNQSEEKFRTIVANVPAIVYRCEPRAEWPMVFINDEVRKITGYPAEKFMDRKINFADVIYPDDRALVEKAVFGALKKQMPFSVEYRLIDAEGKIRWVYERGRGQFDEKGRALWLDGSILDINEKKLVEEELHESESKLQAILNQTYQLMGLLSTDGILLTANQTALDFAGVSLDSSVGKYFWETKWWSHSEGEREKLKGAIKKAASGEFIRYETTNLDRSGARRNLDFSLKPILDKKGKVIYLNPEARDITARKKAEEELERKNQALSELIAQIEMEKNKLKDNLAANVSELILPNLNKMRMSGASRKYVNVVKNQMEQLVSSYGRTITQKSARLSPRELEICNLVQSGLSSKEIANLMHTSLQTIHKHRNNIRKKLGLSNQKINISAYLQRLEA